MATQTKAIATQEKAVVKWKGETITITFRDVKNLICPYASDPEAAIFLRTCQSLQLNPFANEIYLIKYGERDKAAMVIAIDSYLKAAEVNDNFNGVEAGIVLRDSGGRLDLREGSILLSDEVDKLVGGWARVYRKDRERPFYMAVNKAECLRYTRDGNLTQFWAKDKQPSMLRKTALKRALVEAFPSLFAGTLSNVEADYEVLPADVKEFMPKPRGETPEGELPPAYERNGANDWKKFWAKVKSELGLTTEQARDLLDVSSIKEELIDAGWTMEKIWDQMVIAHRLQQATEAPKEARAEETTDGLFPPDKVTVVTPEPVITPPPKPKRDPSTLKTITDLMKALYEDFKLQPKEQLAELNINSWSELTEKPADCYIRIKAVRG